MSAREQAAVEEIQRLTERLAEADARIAHLEQQLTHETARRIVSDMLAEATQDVADSLAENLTAVLSAGDGERDDAIRSARAALAAYEGEAEDGTPMCPCGEPATVELTGDMGHLCDSCFVGSR